MARELLRKAARRIYAPIPCETFLSQLFSQPHYRTYAVTDDCVDPGIELSLHCWSVQDSTGRGDFGRLKDKLALADLGSLSPTPKDATASPALFT